MLSREMRPFLLEKKGKILGSNKAVIQNTPKSTHAIKINTQNRSTISTPKKLSHFTVARVGPPN